MCHFANYISIISASSVPLSFAVNLFQIDWCSKSWAFDHLGVTLTILLQDRFCSNVSRLRLSAFIHNVASVFKSEDWSGDAWGSTLQTWISFCAPMWYLFHNHGRKFRSQTSDNMDRWKAEQGRGREKRKIWRARVRRKKMQMRERAKHCVFPMIWAR